MTPRRLLILVGQEGTGKSTLVRELLTHAEMAAAVDAEDVGQVRPCLYDATFFELLRRNVAGLVANFWEAGYANVIVGSVISNAADYRLFRELLPDVDDINIVQLCADQETRDHRRIMRPKPSTALQRAHVDAVSPEDISLAIAALDFTFHRVDNSRHSVETTIEEIAHAVPRMFDR